MSGSPDRGDAGGLGERRAAEERAVVRCGARDGRDRRRREQGHDHLREVPRGLGGVREAVGGQSDS